MKPNLFSRGLASLPSLAQEAWAFTSLTGAVMKESFADPSVIKTEGSYYAFSTEHHLDQTGKIVNAPVAHSQNFQEGWSILKGTDAMPNLANWVSQPDGHIWDPDVNQLVRLCHSQVIIVSSHDIFELV